jgi:tetratricopeptide (TPR) repeat protein/predicted Ser/Thr protein kinase
MMPDSDSSSEFPRWDASADPERAALALAEAALDLAPEAREAWLTTACARFPHIKPRVESLIEASELAESSGESPPFLTLPPVDDWAAQLAAPFSTGAGPTRLAAGARFGRYRIERFIAAGGMGEVYEARDDALGRRVAIKVLFSAATASRVRRFVNEAGLMARLEHPGIARLYEWSEAEHAGASMPFIAMEYIDGRPIAQAARELPDAKARAALCVQVCEAVAYAHSRGVIHRDLKPANILVDREGQARVLDFGIGSLLDPTARSNLSTTDGAPRPGTLAYMSPEQLRGGADSISTLSDVYSLGLVLYEVFAGRPALAYRDEPIDVILRSVLDEDPPPLGRVSPECGGDLEAIVAFAVRKDPGARYASAAELAEDLSRFLRGDQVRARAPGAWERVRHFARRRRVLTASMAAAAVALGAGLSVAAVQYRRAIDAERKAQTQLEETRRLAKTLLFDLSDAVARLPGSAPTRAMLAERAVQALAPLAEGSRDADLLAELSEGYTKLASVLGVPGGVHVGQFSKTPELLDAARALAQRAVEESPRGFRGWMALGAAELSASMAGSKEQFLDRARSAVAAYARAFELCDRRIDTPEGTVAAERVAYVGMALGGWTEDAAEARASMQASDELYQRLIAEHPDEVLYHQSRAILLRRRGAMPAATDGDAAERDLVEAVSIFDRLLASDPNDYSSVRNRAIALVDLAETRLRRGQTAEAFSLIEDAAASVERTIALDPASTLIREDVLEIPFWRSRVRVNAARSAPNGSAQAAAWATEAVELLEAGLVRARAAAADPSPRDTARLERFEKGLREARELAGVKP